MIKRSARYLGGLVACVLAACGGEAHPETTTAAPPPAGDQSSTAGAPGSPGAVTMPVAGGSPVMEPGMMDPGVVPPATEPTMDGMQDPPQMPQDEPAMPGQPPQLAMDECGLDTKWPGDEYCILPPPPDKGFQLHIGPSDYDNPEPEFIMQPGTETTVSIPAVSGNDQDVLYYYRQYRMRPGSHHWIVTANGRRIGGTQNLAKDNPDGGLIAPENAGVGMPLAAHAQLSNSLHYYNFTDQPIIKEVWLNVWYRDPEDVTEPALEMFSGLGMGITPGTHVIKHGACSITQSGRLLTLYGHVHAHNKRFSAWRTRGGEKLLLHEAFDWEHPGISEFSSVTTNPPLGDGIDGGYSGVVDLMPGDLIEFECDIVNDTNTTFLGRNEAENDEMCIMVGDTVGAKVPGRCTATDVQP